MSKTVAISMIGGVIAGGSLPAAPGAPAAIAVTGFIDPVTNAFTISVNVTPPATLGTFIGCHLYLEIPDQSSGTPFKIGTSAIGDGSATTGAWFYIDLGQFPFSESEPWTVTGPAPATLDATQDIPCRLYANPYSAGDEPALIRANQPGASPNQTFTMTSLASGSPTAGTNVTSVAGPIVATVLSPVNVSGKLQTPVLVDVSTVPNNIPGWAYQLVVTYGTADPTVAANQFVVSSVQNQAGPVQPSAADGITVPHSFEIDTPTSMMTAIVWLQSGLIGSDNSFTANNIVPGITPMWPITYGTTTGTTDASSVMAATIAASMAVVNGLFGVATDGITNTLLGPNAVATINIQNLAITNPLLASLCVQAANLANSSVTAVAIANLAVGTVAIQTGAITNALIANAAISDVKIQTATITGASIATATIAGANIGTATITQTNMASASIGTAQIINASITNALINDVSASKITAGTITAVTITTATINGGAITGTTLSLTSVISGSSVTTAIETGAILTNYAGLSVTGPTGIAAVVSGANTQGLYVADSSSNIQIGLSYASGGNPGLVLQKWSGGSVTASVQLATNVFSMSALPSSNPGTGTKQFWYDPSDNNRVKYAP
jgi:uncharacterized protein YjbI with pentapeptide repeats